ncbi:MAG: type II toxin-antitoxin system HicA family toxin [Lachnospiraceae bacterium]|nr:type II toxin-antitoxin system HicA family toxin [Lachnospiraceae bacterium]
MSKFEKLINDFYNLSNDIRIDEIKKILVYYGYTLSSIKGSHFTFRKNGENPITIPVHGKTGIKKKYIDEIKKIIEKENEKNE